MKRQLQRQAPKLTEPNATEWRAGSPTLPFCSLEFLELEVGGWRLNNLPFELFVAVRYLLARRKQAFISLISLISTLGVDGRRHGAADCAGADDRAARRTARPDRRILGAHLRPEGRWLPRLHGRTSSGCARCRTCMARGAVDQWPGHDQRRVGHRLRQDQGHLPELEARGHRGREGDQERQPRRPGTGRRANCRGS